jgi:hypothetical protein
MAFPACKLPIGFIYELASGIRPAGFFHKPHLHHIYEFIL